MIQGHHIFVDCRAGEEGGLLEPNYVALGDDAVINENCLWCGRKDNKASDSTYCGKCLREPMRIPSELVRRMKAVMDADPFRTQVGDLASFLPADALYQFCKPDADLSEHKPEPLIRRRVLVLMREYMPFAVEKATGHRGLSANRSIEHFKAWVWLLGDYAEIDWNNYKNYGAPILKQISERYGFDLPPSETLSRMARGAPCIAGCDMGCGR